MSADSSAAAMSDVNAAAGSSRKRPRYFWEGPDPLAVEEEKQGSPVARLYQHALESVFDFLYVDDLSRVMAVSQSWSAAVLQMPCARLLVPCDTARLVPLCTSALSKHVDGIEDIDCFTSVESKLHCEALYTLAVRLPQILSIECSVLSSAITKVVLPPKLKTLVLNLNKLAAAAINAVLKGISQLKALCELKLVLPSFLPAISFVPLAAVASLKDLELSSALAGSQPTEAQLDQLRCLPQLQRMMIDCITSQSLAHLLRAPQQLQWQQIHTVWATDAVASAALSSLPSLTTLAAAGCTDIGFLVHLPQLNTLDLNMAQKPWSATLTADAVIDGLSCCTQYLTLTATPLKNKHLSVLLPRLPLLTKLWFWGLKELESLECLRCSPVTQQLLSFRISHCRHAGLKSTELKHVYALLALEELKIENSFTEPLSELELQLHSPPSRVLPKLQEFTYIKLA